MARIATVYSIERRAPQLVDMSYIRWYRISDALARLGHTVDIATGEFRGKMRQRVVEMAPGLRRVPISRIDWTAYDMVKTLFHMGFRTLERYGGADHPFIVSKLGSVVGPADRDGIYFYGRDRERMYRVQEQIHASASYITLLTRQAQDLWGQCFGKSDNLLLVPGAVDADVPAPGADPYPQNAGVRCLFAGNFYTRKSQPEANRLLIEKMNQLGAHLRERGARLYVLGDGHTGGLDQTTVTYLGAASYGESWDYLHHADAGVVLQPGAFLHNNESTKIYHYLRVGLPVVSEEGFPNDDVVRDSGLGYVVENGDMGTMADRVLEADQRDWDREAAVRYILQNHTWDARARVYDNILRQRQTVERA